VCKKVLVSSAIVPIGHAKGTLAFSECELTDKEFNPEEKCVIHEPIVANVLALLILHNGEFYVKFSPQDSGLTFTLIVALDKEEPNECLLPDKAEVKGHALAAIAKKDLIENLLTTKGIERGLAEASLSYENHPSHLEADALARLNDAHLGSSWGYHAL
jgi:hypothetical protein